MLERLAAEFPNVPEYRSELAWAYHAMVSPAALLPPFEAEKTVGKALEIQRRLAADFPEVMFYRFHLIKTLVTLGSMLAKQRRTQEAIDDLREAQAVGEKLAADTPPTVVFIHNLVGRVYVVLAKLLLDAGRVTEANDLERRIIADNRAPEWLNLQAWILIDTPEVDKRDPAWAVVLAEKSVALATNRMNLNTLGIANYRNGNWQGAITALSRAEELAPDEDLSFNGFFLAMAHWQLGEKLPAREWYEKSVQWMEKNKPSDESLRRFRTEAEELMGKGFGKN